MTPTEPTAPPSGLTPELIAQVRALSPDERETLRDLMDAEDGPPRPSDEEVAALIRRRVQEVAAGATDGMTREESTRAIRDSLRAMGHEL